MSDRALSLRWYRTLILGLVSLLIVAAGPGIRPPALPAGSGNPPAVRHAQTTRLKTIIVDNYYPYTYMNSQGQADGFSVDLLKAVAQVMGFEVDIRPDTWQHALDALQSGEIDFLPMMAYSKERDQLFDFSAPHTIAYDAFFTRKGTPVIRSMDDLRGKTILVMQGD